MTTVEHLPPPRRTSRATARSTTSGHWSHYVSADTWFRLWICMHHAMASPRGAVGAVGAVSCGYSWPCGRGAAEFGLVGRGAFRAARACGLLDCALACSLFGTPAQTFQQARAPM